MAPLFPGLTGLHENAATPKIPSISADCLPADASSETDEDADDIPFAPSSQYYNPHNDQITTASRCASIGVFIDDLPIISPGNYDPHLQHYTDLPVLRKLDWQTDDNGNPVRKTLYGTALRAAFIQTRGAPAEISCNWCANGRGIWKSCIVDDNPSKGSESVPSYGVCANCRFSRNWDVLTSGERRPLEPNRRDEIARKNSPPASLPTLGTWGPLERPAGSNNHGDIERPDVAPAQPGSSLKSSKNDGRVVKFPLPLDAVDDLPLLREAFKDLARPLATVDKRIKQLEDKEREKKLNPWDLI
ncbi:hypothetical protein BJY01DRAFT_244963 [Aspergillus pseudoustus]|uniref:Uncharacterized protein n=1 Tax=Aspergillus pseudoustus TaxID=1810923 RepID=A0ABR4KH69_9EURO